MMRAITFLAALTLISGASAPAQDRPPNFLLIIADDITCDD